MHPLETVARRLDDLATGVLAHASLQLRPSILLLRLSLGVVFFGFGLLKFLPGFSPAEGLVTETLDKLTLGLMPEPLGLVLVATMETTIGLCLLSGRCLRLGLALLGLAMIGILSPLALLPHELFERPYFAPTLAGQYVFKDVILLAAGLVVAAGAMSQPDALTLGRTVSRGEIGDARAASDPAAHPRQFDQRERAVA